jgi:putative transposase
MAQRGSQGATRARHLAAPLLEHLIRDEKDYLRHVHYCYFNPVKHGLVANVEDWPYSTFHRDMTTGFNPTDWKAIDGAFGERR